MHYYNVSLTLSPGVDRLVGVHAKSEHEAAQLAKLTLPSWVACMVTARVHGAATEEQKKQTF